MGQHFGGNSLIFRKGFPLEKKMSWNELSSDVVMVILEYAWWNELWTTVDNCSGKIVKSKCASQHYDRSRIMRYMRLNKATYVAVKKMRLLWITILIEYGPKRIGPTSKHIGRVDIGRKCKLNAKGRCHVAQHYGNTLESVYDITQQFGAYDAVIKWSSKRVQRRLIAQVKRDRKKLQEYVETTIPALTAEIESKEARIEYIKRRK